jgi:hypothetical protein
MGQMAKIKIRFECGNRAIGYYAFEVDRLPSVGTTVSIDGRDYRTTGLCKFSGDSGVVDCELLAPTLEERANMVREEFGLGERRLTAEEIAARKTMGEQVKKEFGL